MAEATYKQTAVSGAQRQSAAGSLSRGPSRDLVFLAWVMALTFIGCSLFNVWAHQQVISLGYEISQAAQEEQNLLKESNRLRLELAALKSPKRIENMALKELGLVNPQKQQLIVVR